MVLFAEIVLGELDLFASEFISQRFAAWFGRRTLPV
jgi:hypothetical protein